MCIHMDVYVVYLMYMGAVSSYILELTIHPEFFCSISQKKKITVKAYYINFSMLTGFRTLAGNDFKFFKMWSAF